MNALWGNGNAVVRRIFDFSGTGGPSIASAWNNAVRYASKKASGGTRNKKQGPGHNHGIRRGDGHYVFPGNTLVYRQQRFWYHPGLNVGIAKTHLKLVALKEGIVRVTCEKPDLNYRSNRFVQNWYAGTENKTFLKKYFHVIPPPQHTRFKCIDQI